MVLAALRRHGIDVRSPADENRRRNPLLHQPDELERRVAETSVAEVAERLGVTKIAVQVALRHGAQSAHRYRGKVRLDPPDDEIIAYHWNAEGTVKGVPRALDVSINTAAIWLAQTGIFLSDAPAIEARDLKEAIRRGDSIDVIRRRHAVTDRTVVVELIRHGLHDAHRTRHMTDRGRPGGEG